MVVSRAAVRNMVISNSRKRRAYAAAVERLISVDLDMLFQVLGTLEWLSAGLALVWLGWDVDTDMRGDMVALAPRHSASIPFALKTQVTS